MDPALLLALIADLYAAGRTAQNRITELEAQLAELDDGPMPASKPEGEPHGND